MHVCMRWVYVCACMHCVCCVCDGEKSQIKLPKTEFILTVRKLFVVMARPPVIIAPREDGKVGVLSPPVRECLCESVH